MAEFQGKRFSAPCHFVSQTSRHLKNMLEKGMARYLFPLDAGHGHLLIPEDLWHEKYRNSELNEALGRILREPRVAVLYHTAEHLDINDHSSTNEQITNWKVQRNTLGFYDGSELKVLPPFADGSGHQRVEGYRPVLTFVFLGHRLGELTVSALGVSHSFDVSFNDDLADGAETIPTGTNGSQPDPVINSQR